MSLANHTLFLHELAAVMLADGTLPAQFARTDGPPLIVGAQSAAPGNPPWLAVMGEFTPYPNGRCKGILSLEIRSRQGDERADADINHASRLAAVHAWLFGEQGDDAAETRANAAAALAAIQSALTARGKVGLYSIGPARDYCDAGAEGEDLRSTLKLNCAFGFLPPG